MKAGSIGIIDDLGSIGGISGQHWQENWPQRSQGNGWFKEFQHFSIKGNGGGIIEKILNLTKVKLNRRSGYEPTE